MDVSAPQHGTGSSAALAVHFVAVGLGPGRLLLPQAEVRALEPWLDVTPAESGGGPNAWLVQGRTRWPVYALDPELERLDGVPGDRPVCVLLDAMGLRLALACTEVAAVDPGHLRLQPLPPSMATARGPARQLAILDEQIVPVSDVAGLTRHLGLTALPGSRGRDRGP